MVTQERRTLDASIVDAFAQTIRGQVIQPSDEAYDRARTVRNGLIDRRPAAIVRCRGTGDVASAVRFAAEHALTLSVRGGAHNVAGTAVNDDGLVIDLSDMRAVHVDPERGTALVQGGATWGDVDRETQRYAMSVPGGVVSTTGVGGLTLHGGLGHMRRTYGLSIDSIVAVEVVTADGEVRTASPDRHADLFWAVRGAGSNFGVVTSFEFRMHPIGPEVFLAGVMYPQEDAVTVLRGWREFAEGSPDEINAIALLWSVPDHEAFPEELRRRPIVLTAAIYDGPVAEGERATQALRELGEPLLDLSHPEAFVEVQQAFDPFFPTGRNYYWKSTYVDDLSDEAIAVIIERGRARGSGMSAVTLWQLGGAITRVDPRATAYYRRDAPYLLAAEATWDGADGTEENIRWSRDTVAAMQPFSHGGMYVNFGGFGEEKEAILRTTYGPNYDRLVEIKNTYDPGNLFHMNQNIPPTVSG